MAPWVLIAALLAQETAGLSAQGERHTSIFPLPMYTTNPNEGSTYGFMPVFLVVGVDGEINTIWAPSVSWNRAAGVTCTFRYYRYPSRDVAWNLIASASTHVNRTVIFTYDRLPFAPGTITVETMAMIRQNLFYRFFGLGPDSTEAGESSYTRVTALLNTRTGINLPAHLNGGLRFTVRGDQPKEHAIFGLPPLQQVHPDAPGIDGGAMALVGLSLRYDDRRGGDYAERGLSVEVAGNHAFGLNGFDHFWQLTGQARALWPELSFLQGAARLWVTDELGGHNVPFYYQSTLGGEMLLRGFPEDRFIDRGAWEAETEQRIRILRTHLFHVLTDWRVDPFVAVGQVYGHLGEIARRPRWSVGLGLRTWVHPNVLGRVDVAYTDEGIRAYVVLKYPY